ncbi:MAG: oligosaccharide flippase family protein [candidate division KSB1 bacterium]
MKLGRATILLLLSQTIVLASGLAVNLGLARLLGVVEYGNYGLVISVLVVIEIFVIAGIPEVIQKFGGEQPEAMAQLVRQTLRWQMLYTVLLYGGLWLATPLLVRDESLIALLRIAGLDIIVYGLYKYFLGVQNGLHRFQPYSWLGIIYALSRAIAILGLVALGFSVQGALIGNIIASCAGLLFALFWYRPPRVETAPMPVRYGAWALQNVLYSFGLNTLFAIDLWLIKYFLSEHEVGLYVSVSVLAKLSYLMSIAVSVMLLPSLARATAQQQEQRSEELIRDTLRYLLIFLTLLNLVVALFAKEIIALLFGAQFADAANVLVWLMAGHSCITLMAVSNTVMIARNMMHTCFVRVLALVALDVALNFALVPRFQLLGGALATSLVGVLGAALALWHIRREAKPLLFSWSIPRMLGVALGVYIIAQSVAFASVDFIAKAIVLTGLYFLLLWMSKEISAVDLRRLRESLGVPK